MTSPQGITTWSNDAMIPATGPWFIWHSFKVTPVPCGLLLIPNGYNLAPWSWRFATKFFVTGHLTKDIGLTVFHHHLEDLGYVEIHDSEYFCFGGNVAYISVNLRLSINLKSQPQRYSCVGSQHGGPWFEGHASLTSVAFLTWRTDSPSRE